MLGMHVESQVINDQQEEFEQLRNPSPGYGQPLKFMAANDQGFDKLRRRIALYWTNFSMLLSISQRVLADLLSNIWSRQTFHYVDFAARTELRLDCDTAGTARQSVCNYCTGSAERSQRAMPARGVDNGNKCWTHPHKMCFTYVRVKGPLVLH